MRYNDLYWAAGELCSKNEEKLAEGVKDGDNHDRLPGVEEICPEQFAHFVFEANVDEGERNKGEDGLKGESRSVISHRYRHEFGDDR